MIQHRLDLEKYARIARQAVAEGCVLLKNEKKALPLTKGDKVAVGNQDYYYVNKLLETHIGNPFSLGMLYCIVAERLNLPIYPVVLPHHFVLAYCKKTRHFPQLEDVLFYINPFNNGIVLTRRDIRSYLDQLNIKSELRYFEPTRNTSVIRSIFNMELRV